MSRNPQIEAIHEARYNLETCEENARGRAKAKLEKLVAESIDCSGAKISPRQLLDALFDDYKEYRRARRREEWPRL